jgi:hypothetical protein
MNNNKDIWVSNDTINFATIILPLEFKWQPMPDITTYELALCMSILLSTHIMPDQIDLSQSYLRHFSITNPNKRKSNA